MYGYLTRHQHTRPGPVGSGLSIVTACCALLGGGLAGASENAVEGEAFGVYVDLENVGVRVSVGETPRVVLPPGGGADLEQVLRIEVPGAVVSDTMSVSTSGAIGADSASAQSGASVEGLAVLDGLITAELVVAVCASNADGVSAVSGADGSTLLGLSIDGVWLGDVTPAPNTEIPVPGVGTIILNEQLAAGDGAQSSGLTVNMIHVVLEGLAGSGDVIVSSARCAVDFTPAPLDPTGFMTGGGKLGSGRDIATFGLNAGWKAGGLRGHVQYIDHGGSLNVHATTVDYFEQVSEHCVSFSGAARVNGADGYQYSVTLACDEGEPGRGVDELAISVDGPGLAYQRQGTLSGGNLQLH